VTQGSGGAGKPPPPDRDDDPMFRPASDAGWSDAPAKPAAASPTAASPTAASPAAGSPIAASPTAASPAAASPTAASPAAASPTAASPTAASPTATSPTAAPPATSSSVAASPPIGSPHSSIATSPTTAVSSMGATSGASPAPPPSTARRATTPPSSFSATVAPGVKATVSLPSTTPATSRGVAFPAYVPPSPPAGTVASKPAAIDDPTLPDLPATHDENALRAAVGVSPLRSDKPSSDAGDRDGAVRDTDDEPDEPRGRRPRTVLAAALAVAGLVGVGVLVLVGYLNSDRYVLACEPDLAVPEQGRGFPPWGTRPLAGATWHPLKIAPETRCKPVETDDPLVLERSFLAMVLDQASAQLSAHEVAKVDDAEALLEQALLLTRPPEHETETLAKERTERHQEVERLLGDVAFWRGAAKVRDAASALGDAIKQFDAAVAQHPQHATDAPAWAAHARRLAQDLRTGPSGAPGSAPAAAPPTASPSGERPAAAALTAPPGTALPVEPEKSPATPAQAAPPDAGTPTGGVLL
jgi:hypothetical protein